MDASDVITDRTQHVLLPIGSKAFSYTKRALLGLWHLMLQSDSQDVYHDWHSRSLVLSGLMVVQDPPIGGSTTHYSDQDHIILKADVPTLLLPEHAALPQALSVVPPQGTLMP